MFTINEKPELVALGYLTNEAKATRVQQYLWKKFQLVSVVDRKTIGRKTVFKLLVTYVDKEKASEALKKFKLKVEDFVPPEDFESFEQESLEKILFHKDRKENKTTKSESNEAQRDTDAKITENVIRNIRRLFGEKEARKMMETLKDPEKTPEKTPEVSIIILMHNKWLHTQRCLWSLFDTKDVNFELILVDNGSTEKELKEGISSYLNECLIRDIPVRLLVFNENVGAVKGRNEAIPYCNGDFIVFLDNDIVVRRRSWLSTMLNYLKKHPKTGAIGPKLLYPNEPHLIQHAGCDVSPTGRVNFRGRGLDKDTPEFNELRKVQCLISACIVFPKKVVEEVGLLDMAYHPVQFEDIDYCYRIKEKGYELVYTPEVEMYHFENVTTGGTQKLNYTYLTIKNGKVFKDKWGHMYSKENGPEEADMVWRDVLTVDITEIGGLKVLN